MLKIHWKLVYFKSILKIYSELWRFGNEIKWQENTDWNELWGTFV